jgi:hypothetical protein
VYLFEYFEHGDAGALEVTHILEQCADECLSNETVLCSIAFLVHTLITVLFQGRDNKDASEPALARIARSQPPADLLLSQCITVVLLDVDRVDGFIDTAKYLQGMDTESLLHEVIQFNFLVVALYHTIYNRDELLDRIDPLKLANGIVQWCVVKRKNDREHWKRDEFKKPRILFSSNSVMKWRQRSVGLTLIIQTRSKTNVGGATFVEKHSTNRKIIVLPEKGSCVR